MFGVDLASLALLSAAAFVLAAPVEYLCGRMGWGTRTRLLAWAIGAAIIVGLIMLRVYPALDASLEEMCARSRYSEWMRNCAGVKQQFYPWLLPFLVGLLLMLWSALYAMALAIYRLIYRRVVPRQRASS
jgi:hypothetical protein